MKTVVHLLRRFVVLSLALPAFLLAAPGAHGPDGEHLDAPAQAGAGSAAPRVAAQSELFELVATLHADELSILIDRFATNEPVLNADVEVESGAVKAKAKFHADHGDYAIDDSAFLKAVSGVGEHALVITVAAGKDADLLDAKLVVAGRLDVHDHGDGQVHGAHAPGIGRAVWIGAAVAALALASLAAWRVRRRRIAASGGLR
jgi:hypothetical protein